MQSQPSRLLRDYRKVVRRRQALAIPNTAIRLGSRSARELLAFDALDGTGGVGQLERLGRGESFDAVGIDPKRPSPARLASYARTLALQQLDPSDVDIALGLLDLVERRWGADRIPPLHQGVHAQLLWSRGDLDGLARLLRRYRGMAAETRASLELDLAHPVRGRGRDWDRWTELLGRWMPPAEWSVSEGEADPLDRLRATSAKRPSPFLVTVAVTCFRPDESLLTAVRSLTGQSWERLEILIVDDGSGPEFSPVLERAAALDERITLVRLEANQGTYAARNHALDLATGRMLTFQDSDDWSHPDRIALQVESLESVPGAVAAVADGIKMGADLTVDRVGRPVTGISMPSTMIRLDEVKARVGYFHHLRKAADGEYLERLKAVFGEEAVVHDPRLLQLLRQGEGSLSRSDFAAGGSVHPAREAYHSAYGFLHKAIAAGEADPYVPKGSVPVPADAHLSGAEPADRRDYDYVFATDWRPYGAPAKSTIEEINALLATGARIGVIQLDAYRYATNSVRPLCDPIQELVSSGAVDRVLADQEAHTRILFVRYPPVLQFDRARPPLLTADQVVVIANQAPCELDGSDVRYSSAICTANAEAWFGVSPIWIPQGVETLRALEREGELRPSQIGDATLPAIVDAERWAMPRSRFRSDRPVVGRHSRDHYSKWPDTSASLLQVYPDDPNFDVRVMGGAEVPQRLLGGGLPVNWTVYGYDEVEVRSFLFQLDFWVYFHHPVLVESFGRAVLEAMATGCVVVLPPHFADTFGDGALYCEAAEVESTITALWKDFDAFREQSERGLRYVRDHFDHASHRARVTALTGLSRRIPEQRCDTISTTTTTIT